MRDIVMRELEAYFALSNGYMNMSSYAYRIKPKVEMLTKKQVTITSLGGFFVASAERNSKSQTADSRCAYHKYHHQVAAFGNFL